ncbi:hypothetical protein HEO25_021085, partial [Escherichia coli]|nr:hypothetical protein [Escherichia coli]
MDKIILPTGFLPMLTVKQIEAAKPKEKPYRLTPVTLETAPSSASNGVIDGNA